MTKLSAIRDVSLSIRAEIGDKPFSFVWLTDEVCQRLGGITYQDTTRRYLRGFLADEIPTVRIKKGVYKFQQEPTQGELFNGGK